MRTKNNEIELSKKALNMSPNPVSEWLKSIDFNYFVKKKSNDYVA